MMPERTIMGASPTVRKSEADDPAPSSYRSGATSGLGRPVCPPTPCSISCATWSSRTPAVACGFPRVGDEAATM